MNDDDKCIWCRQPRDAHALSDAWCPKLKSYQRVPLPDANAFTDDEWEVLEDTFSGETFRMVKAIRKGRDIDLRAYAPRVEVPRVSKQQGFESLGG